MKKQQKWSGVKMSKKELARIKKAERIEIWSEIITFIFVMVLVFIAIAIAWALFELIAGDFA